MTQKRTRRSPQQRHEPTPTWQRVGLLQPATWVREVPAEAIKDLLRAGPCVFVVVDYLSARRWVDPAECFTFWKSEVQAHLCDAARPYREDYPDDYCYDASAWRLRSADTIIVLQLQH